MNKSVHRLMPQYFVSGDSFLYVKEQVGMTTKIEIPLRDILAISYQVPESRQWENRIGIAILIALGLAVGGMGVYWGTFPLSLLGIAVCLLALHGKEGGACVAGLQTRLGMLQLPSLRRPSEVVKLSKKLEPFVRLAQWTDPPKRSDEGRVGKD